MSDFKAKMHPTRFRRWGAYSALPDLLSGFKGPTSKRREGNGRRGGEGKGRKGRGREMEGPTYKGMEVKGGKTGRGRVPPVITVPPRSRGARIVTVYIFVLKS